MINTKKIRAQIEVVKHLKVLELDAQKKLVKINRAGVPSAESSRSVRGMGKGVSDKPYPCLCNVRRPIGWGIKNGKSFSTIITT